MKSKKVTMLAAALVVAVVALAGIGYAAATQYTATTENTNNTIGSTYIVISQDGDPQYAVASLFANVYFDTVNTATSTEYTPVYTHHTTSAAVSTFVENTSTYTPATGDEQYALISVPLILNIAKTNSGASTADIVVTVDNFTKLTDITYVMVLAPSTATAASIAASVMPTGGDAVAGTGNTATWTFDDVTLGTGLNGSISYNVFILVKGTITTSADTLGFNLSGADSKFVFKVTAESTSNDGPAATQSP